MRQVQVGTKRDRKARNLVTVGTLGGPELAHGFPNVLPHLRQAPFCRTPIARVADRRLVLRWRTTWLSIRMTADFGSASARCWHEITQPSCCRRRTRY